MGAKTMAKLRKDSRLLSLEVGFEVGRDGKDIIGRVYDPSLRSIGTRWESA